MKQKTLNFIKKYALKIFLGFWVICLIYSLFEVYWIEIKNNTIVNSQIPRSFDDTKVVFISDIHSSAIFPAWQIRNIVNKVNNLEPDIIILGWDYVEEWSDYVDICFNELKNLKAKYGIYAVLGNHDHRWWKDLILKKMNESGIKLLENANLALSKNNERIYIAWLTDLLYDYPDEKLALSWTTNKDFVLMVSHDPDIIEFEKDTRIDLMFSGHNHWWQVSFFGLRAGFRVPSFFWNKFRTWVTKIIDTYVLVSNWVWVNGLPIRFFARPQINVIWLKSK